MVRALPSPLLSNLKAGGSLVWPGGPLAATGAENDLPDTLAGPCRDYGCSDFHAPAQLVAISQNWSAERRSSGLRPCDSKNTMYTSFPSLFTSATNGT